MKRNQTKLFGKQLARVRKSKGVKQHELEERIGKEGHYVSHLETGTSKPAFDRIFELADGLDVSPMELFFFAGIDDNKEILRKRIDDLLEKCDEVQLRKAFRLLLVSFER